MEPTDVLITRVLAGELDLYAEIVRRHQSDVWRAAAFMTRDPRTTEDLVQQAFVNAFQHLDRFRLGSDFGVWIKAIARNLARQELRTRSREDRRMEVYQELLENRRVEERETAVGDALRLCREQLPGRGAEALTMRYERGLGFDEIADALGATVNATRQLLSRVRIALRDCIEKRLAQT
ncbi:MAG TPA: sigma-70 family RNA polymerase sigma factor [Planctomycetota bacterium]